MSGTWTQAGEQGVTAGLFTSSFLRQCPHRRLDLGHPEAEAARGAGAAVRRALLPVGPAAGPAGHLHGGRQGVPVVAGGLRVGAGTRGR